jgi:tellurite resistance protein TerC
MADDMAENQNLFRAQRQGSDAPGPGLRAAVGWCAAFLALSLAVAAAVWRWRGGEAAQQYLAGYLVELGLSADNVFVFLLIFTRFQVPADLQRRVLAWGIWGAVVLRGVFLLAGFGLIHRFHAVLYVFGAFLLVAGVRLARARGPASDFDPSRGAAVRFLRRHLPVSDHFHGRRFFVVEQGRRVATLLFVVLLVVELTDLVFALDSLPAVIAVTRSSAIAIASNICAILGLRSLYFVLGGLTLRFRHLKAGLAAILAFIGAKMLLEPWIALPTWATLAVIAAILTVAALAGRDRASA